MRLVLADIFKYEIQEIDRVHDQMVAMINEIGDCLSNSDFDSALRLVIHLIAIERKHAQYENILLEEHRSDQLENHKGYHAKLSNLLNSMMVALGDGDQNLSISLHTQLCEAFLDDLLSADLPFKSFLQNRIMGK